MTFFRYKRTPTPSAGVWSGYITDDLPETNRPDRYKLHPMFMRQLVIRSASSDTTFNAWLTDYEGIVIRKWTTATEVINDLTLTPIMGKTQITIDSASADEEFTVLAVLEERPGSE